MRLLVDCHFFRETADNQQPVVLLMSTANRTKPHRLPTLAMARKNYLMVRDEKILHSQLLLREAGGQDCGCPRSADIRAHLDGGWLLHNSFLLLFYAAYSTSVVSLHFAFIIMVSSRPDELDLASLERELDADQYSMVNAPSSSTK